MTKRSPFRYFRTSPEIIRLAVMLYIRFPLSLRYVEDLARARHRGELRDGQVLVAALRPVVRTGDPAEAGGPDEVISVALAPR